MALRRGGPKRTAPLSFGDPHGSTIAVALLVLVGGLLRAWPVAEWPISHLEALTWHRSQTGAGLAEFPAWDHPPLSYLLVCLSTALLGTQAEWALRLPSLLAGILCIPAAFTVTPYLTIRGAADAIDWYKKAFGAEEV